MVRIVDLDTEELRAGLDDGTMIVVDVREPHELESGMIPGSVSMPLSRFDPAALPAEAGRRVVFSCAAGVRSRTAIGLAQAGGRDLCEHYAGGFQGWLRSGSPVTYPDE